MVYIGNCEILPLTDEQNYRQFSTDGGSSFLSAKANYSWVNQGVAGSSETILNITQTTSYGGFQKSGMGNDAAEGVNLLFI